MKERRILIVEDDPEQFRLINEELQFAFKDVKIESIRTESDFREEVNNIIASPPDLILMDMMLRWSLPAPPEKMPAMPEHIEEEGYYRAGIRCTKLLLEKNPQNTIPILVFTVLHHEDLEKDLNEIREEDSVFLAYLQKTAPIKKLLHEINRIAPQLKE